MVRGLAGVLLASCSPVVHACTEIGCDDALVVRFDRAPAGAFRVEAITAPGAAPAVFECAAGDTCPAAYFPGVEAERVTIRVTTSAGTRSQEFAPEYQDQYPNGRRCGAVCRQATVTFPL
jgi:hypothetical protein